MIHRVLLLCFLLAACSAAPVKQEDSAENLDPSSEAGMMRMCVDENVGVFRFSRAYLEDFCPKLKAQFELICFRFVHATKEWRKACLGIDTADKLECISTIANGPSYALLESLQMCKDVKNRRQVYCLSRAVSKSGIPLQPETVKACLEKQALP